MKIRLVFLFTYCVLQTFAQYVQFGHKLTATGNVDKPSLGSSLSISADGKTIAVGGERDSLFRGATWIYTFNGHSFVQAGNKLYDHKAFSPYNNDNLSYSSQGSSVSLSADGKTVLVGGTNNMLTFYDGGAWVFTFNGSNYTQVGDKLVVNDAMPNSGIGLGISVSLSADGKTAIIGGDQDNNFAGAAWIFTFNGINFVQFGPKLIGAGSIESSLQGFSVCISGDGKTAIIGGIADNKSIGATWIFTFDGNNFVQVAKLVGSESIGMYIEQGWSVSLSDDGKTALIGGPGDNSGIGAAWVYTFNGSNYIQLAKLIGKDATANAYQGTSVSLTPDGKTAIIGGEGDNNQAGAIWIFTFNGANFVQVGNKLTGSGNSGPASQGHAVAISQDAKFIFSGGISDNSGVGAVWIFNTCIYTNPSPNFNFDIWNDTLYLTSTSKGEILTHQWIVSGDHINLMPAIRYRLKKEDLKRGTLDVRLIVTDLNGCKDSVSRIIKIPPQLSGIASSNNSDIFKVYPNPFHDILSIETNISGTFTIYNSLGQVVFKKLVLGSENIELNNISPGVYYYQFVNYNLVVGKKLLKE